MSKMLYLSSFDVIVQQNTLRNKAMVDTSIQLLSSADYLALDAPIQGHPDPGHPRYDFYKGELTVHEPETEQHNQLVKRVASLLEADSGLRRCTVFSTNTKIEVQPDVSYLYADIAVTCNFLEFKSNNPIMRQPRLLAEVLSPQSRERDRGFKWQQYQQVLSLWYYLLVDLETKTIDVYSHSEGTGAWQCHTYRTNRPDTFPSLRDGAFGSERLSSISD